ncbi:MAG: hypothetical protein RLZZ350_1144 [Verrucomicrobiota bacterium]
MKISFALLGAWLMVLAQATAQVTVELVPSQDQFLPAESLPIAARITNLSGQSLTCGADAEWLTFSVVSRDGFVVSEVQKVPVQGEFTLDSSKVATKHVDLSPCFNMTKPGRYEVTATVRIKDWNQQFTSKPCPVEIIPGSKLRELEFGVPQPGGSPEVRKYALLQANYLKQLMLYVRVTDAAESKVFKVFTLGRMISFSEPEPQVDKAGNLHVLWQTSARGFAYRMVSPDGEVVASQTYDYVGTHPRLYLDQAGKISVAGGVRRLTRDDLPVEAPAPPAAVPVPAEASTNAPAALK